MDEYRPCRAAVGEVGARTGVVGLAPEVLSATSGAGVCRVPTRGLGVLAAGGHVLWSAGHRGPKVARSMRIPSGTWDSVGGYGVVVGLGNAG